MDEERKRKQQKVIKFCSFSAILIGIIVSIAASWFIGIVIIFYGIVGLVVVYYNKKYRNAEKKEDPIRHI